MSGVDANQVHISIQPLEDSCQDIQLSVNLPNSSIPDPATAQSVFSAPRIPEFLTAPWVGLSGVAKLLGEFFPASTNVSASRSSINFGQVQIYSSSSESFSVTNNGKCKANLSFSTSSPFSVSSGGSLEAGATRYFSVTFSPYSEDQFSNYVSGNHGISIYLNGEGVDRYKSNRSY